MQNDIHLADSAEATQRSASPSLAPNESHSTLNPPLPTSSPQHSPFKRSRPDSTARSSTCALRRRKPPTIGWHPSAPWTTAQLKRLQEAAAVHHSKRLPLPQLSTAGNVIPPTPTGISRLPRAAKRPAPVQSLLCRHSSGAHPGVTHRSRAGDGLSLRLCCIRPLSGGTLLFHLLHSISQTTPPGPHLGGVCTRGFSSRLVGMAEPFLGCHSLHPP